MGKPAWLPESGFRKPGRPWGWYCSLGAEWLPVQAVVWCLGLVWVGSRFGLW